MTIIHYPNSLVTLVTEFVRDKGMATLTEVAAEFPDRTKKQIHDALSNARHRKLLKVILRGNFRGRRESVWAIETEKPTPTGRVKSEKPPRVASVWELGSPVLDGPWPPVFEGAREYRLLGPWNAPEEQEMTA